jgi:hypothetical protein
MGLIKGCLDWLSKSGSRPSHYCKLLNAELMIVGPGSRLAFIGHRNRQSVGKSKLIFVAIGATHCTINGKAFVVKQLIAQFIFSRALQIISWDGGWVIPAAVCPKNPHYLLAQRQCWQK